MIVLDRSKRPPLQEHNAKPEFIWAYSTYSDFEKKLNM